MDEKEKDMETVENEARTYHRIGIFQNSFSKVLLEGLSRIGLPEVRIVTNVKEMDDYGCGIVLVADDDTSKWNEIYEQSRYLNIPLMFMFNFGTGSCVTVTDPRGVRPDFLSDPQGREPWKWMFDYTRGHNAFFNVTNHEWLDSAEKWMEYPSIKNSIGVYAQTMAAINMIAVMAHGSEVYNFPKFYLLSMVGQN
jgi:hypothetical protein